METPKKGLFQRAFSSLFNDKSPLQNEPTIDYEQTIETYPGFDDKGLRTPSSAQFRGSERFDDIDLPKSHYGVDSLNFSDSDDDIGHDIDYVFNNYTHTQDKIKSLPSDYPGRFPTSTFLMPQKGSNSGIDKEIEQLQREIDLDNDINIAKSNANMNRFSILGESENSGTEARYSGRKRLQSILTQVSTNNEFLKDMNDYVNINDVMDVSENMQHKYQKLREEYISELKNCQKFYKAYYSLVQKYRNIKAQLKQSQVGLPPLASSVRMKEKINYIKSNTELISVKTACNALAHDIDLKDETLRYYELELKKANQRIEDLGQQLAKG